MGSTTCQKDAIMEMGTTRRGIRRSALVALALCVSIGAGGEARTITAPKPLRLLGHSKHCGTTGKRPGPPLPAHGDSSRENRAKQVFKPALAWLAPALAPLKSMLQGNPEEVERCEPHSTFWDRWGLSRVRAGADRPYKRRLVHIKEEIVINQEPWLVHAAISDVERYHEWGGPALKEIKAVGGSDRAPVLAYRAGALGLTLDFRLLWDLEAASACETSRTGAVGPPTAPKAMAMDEKDAESAFDIGAQRVAFRTVPSPAGAGRGGAASMVRSFAGHYTIARQSAGKTTVQFEFEAELSGQVPSVLHQPLGRVVAKAATRDLKHHAEGPACIARYRRPELSPVLRLLMHLDGGSQPSELFLGSSLHHDSAIARIAKRVVDQHPAGVPSLARAA